MPRASISIDARLSAIAQMCGRCENLADIGADHGKLAAYMLQTGMCRRAHLTDISATSLEKAHLLLGKLGLLERSVLRIGDGAQALDAPPDVAVIAGMGGETIGEIVRRGSGMLHSARLVMQPNVAAAHLRRALAECGYAIVDENIVRDGRRLYIIIAACAGSAHYDEFEAEVGPVLMHNRPGELYDYAQFRLRVARKALKGIQAGGGDESAVARDISIWEEVAAWQG